MALLFSKKQCHTCKILQIQKKNHAKVEFFYRARENDRKSNAIPVFFCRAISKAKFLDLQNASTFGQMQSMNLR